MAKGQEFTEIKAKIGKWHPQTEKLSFFLLSNVIVLNAVILCFITLVPHPMLFERSSQYINCFAPLIGLNFFLLALINSNSRTILLQYREGLAASGHIRDENLGRRHPFPLCPPPQDRRTFY